MDITLRKITKSNWEQCIALKPKEEQQSFIASNLYSLAESKFLPNFETLGIYADDCMVGFTMFGIDPEDHHYWLYRFMIDHSHQGKGYGKKAMLRILSYIHAKEDATDIVVAYHPENHPAAAIYKKVGFQVVGMAPWGEEMAKYPLNYKQ
ncbi:GNAT family N-acetyltransferase [Bacillus timonensis]|nr:GNAT family N-acetyltransferase [Bacillus timonensis]